MGDLVHLSVQNICNIYVKNHTITDLSKYLRNYIKHLHIISVQPI